MGDIMKVRTQTIIKGNTWSRHPEYDKGFKAGQKSKQEEFRKAVLSLRNEFDLWSDDNETFHVIDAQIEQIEGLLK